MAAHQRCHLYLSAGADRATPVERRRRAVATLRCLRVISPVVECRFDKAPAQVIYRQYPSRQDKGRRTAVGTRRPGVDQRAMRRCIPKISQTLAIDAHPAVGLLVATIPSRCQLSRKDPHRSLHLRNLGTVCLAVVKFQRLNRIRTTRL